MEKKPIVLWSTLLLLFALVTGVAVWKVWPLLNPEVQYLAALDRSCDLRSGACRSQLPGGSMSFSIEPRAIPVVQPLRLSVEVTGVAVRSVEVDFAGVDMNMGYNRPKLERLAEGRFAGDGMLPVCVRDAMEWEARVLLHTDAGLLAAPFRFITVKPGTNL